jgi:hypothetical protein
VKSWSTGAVSGVVVVLHLRPVSDFLLDLKHFSHVPNHGYGTDGANPTIRVARFFVVQHTETGKKLPNNHKINQMATQYTK